MKFSNPSFNELVVVAQGKTNNTSSQKISQISYNYINSLSKARIAQVKKEAEIMV